MRLRQQPGLRGAAIQPSIRNDHILVVDLDTGRNVLLGERKKSRKLEIFSCDVERLFHGFRAEGGCVGP